MPNREEIEQQQQLLTTYRHNLALYLQQRAQLGAAYIPPNIANGIRDACNNIERVKHILRGWNIQVEDHPDDLAAFPQEPVIRKGQRKRASTNNRKPATETSFSKLMKSVAIHENQWTANFRRLIESAQDRIDILQTYVPIIEAIGPALQSAFENGCKIRLLVSKLDSIYLDARLAHLGRGTAAAAHSLDMLRAIVRNAKSPKGAIEIRAYDFLPYFPYYRIDNRVYTGFFLKGGSYRFPQIEFNVNDLESAFPDLLAHFDEYWNLKDNIDLIRNWDVQEAIIQLGIPVITNVDECQTISRDASLYKGSPIGVIRFPGYLSTTAVVPQLTQLVQIASRKKVPLTFVGSRTSLAGQAVNRNGIVVDMSTFRNVSVNTSDMNPHVQTEPGVILDNLNVHIKRNTRNTLVSLEFEHTLDLSSSHMATIGGAIMNNGGGILSSKYGSARDNVYDLEILLPDGRNTWTSEIKERGRFADLYHDIRNLIEHTGPDRVIDAYKMKKNSSGYNLKPLAENVKKGESVDITQLLVGSEGTLGILLRAKVKIWKAEPPKVTVLVFFDSFSDACRAIENTLKITIDDRIVMPSALEVISGSIFEVIRDLRLELPAECEPPVLAKEAVLLIEYDDPENIAVAAIKQLKIVCEHYAPRNTDDYFRVIENSEKRKNFWFLRKNIVKILNDYGRKYDLIAPPIIEDIGVPVDSLVAILHYLHEEFDRLGLKAAIYGHAGDGNLHVRPLLKGGHEQMEMAYELMDRVYRKVISLNGTISAEHGDGLLRTPYLELQYGTPITSLFKGIKELFDPNYILNLGVKVPHPDYPDERHRHWDILGYRPVGGGTPIHPDNEDLIP
jgi:FAD/FMN-containing dehydrogenase